MNTKVVVLSLISVLLIFAVTKSIVLAAAFFVLEVLLWYVVRGIKMQRWRIDGGPPPSLS